MVADLDAIVSRIPAWRGQELSVTPLAGGMTNASHLVTVDGRPITVFAFTVGGGKVTAIKAVNDPARLAQVIPLWAS